MDTVLAEFNRRKSEHNHTGRVIDTNFQSVIYEINFSQVALIIDFWFFPHFATFYLIKWAFLLMTSHSSQLIITLISLINVEPTLTNLKKFHPPQNKNSPSTFIDFLDFSSLHSSFNRVMFKFLLLIRRKEWTGQKKVG